MKLNERIIFALNASYASYASGVSSGTPSSKSERVKIKAALESITFHCHGYYISKTQLVKIFNEDIAFINRVFALLKRKGYLHKVKCEEKSNLDGLWESVYLIKIPKTAPPMTSPKDVEDMVKHRSKIKRYGQGKCDRCGGFMYGKSQRNREKRGHDRSVCDSNMIAFVTEL